MLSRFFRAIKNWLRSVRGLAALNATVKAHQLRAGLQHLAKCYADCSAAKGVHYEERAAVAEFRKRLLELRPQGFPKKEGYLRVFWVGANRDQDESGFLQALRKIATVIEFRNFKGGYGQWYWDEDGQVRVFDPSIVALNDRCLLEQVDAEVRGEGVDLLLGQMWANYISKEALGKIGGMGIPIINISMDDRLPDNWATKRGTRLGAVGLTSVTDLVLTTSSETCSWYACEGCAAIFWPLASDPDVFSSEPDAQRDIDVLFIGNKYGVRGKIIAGLGAKGIQVDCYGGGWPNGVTTAEESCALFKRAKIVLGVGTVGHCDDIYTLKLRDFDAPMSGALYLTHRNLDLLKLYDEGKEIECYSSIDECARKIAYYLTHPEELKRVSAAGRARAVARDTWHGRLTRTFARLGVLELIVEKESRE